MDLTPSFLYLGERWYYFPGGTEEDQGGGSLSKEQVEC